MATTTQYLKRGVSNTTARPHGRAFDARFSNRAAIVAEFSAKRFCSWDFLLQEKKTNGGEDDGLRYQVEPQKDTLVHVRGRRTSRHRPR